MIPHGARANLSPATWERDSGRRPLILISGLIGPGKGIEFMIDALARLRDLDPPPRYVVLGQTHPRGLEREGEAYRDSLIARARALGVDYLVEFDNSYRPTESVCLDPRRRDRGASLPTARATRLSRACWSRRSPRESRWSQHASRMRSSCSGRGPASSSRTRIRRRLQPHWRPPYRPGARRPRGSRRPQTGTGGLLGDRRPRLRQLAAAAAGIRVRVAS